jgi:hypothetical protein
MLSGSDQVPPTSDQKSTPNMEKEMVQSYQNRRTRACALNKPTGVRRTEYWTFAFQREFWNWEAPSFTNFLVNTSNKIMTHYRWPTTSLFIVNACSPIFEYSAPLSYSSFTHVFSMKKVDINANFAAGGHIITHAIETRTNTRQQVMLWFTRQWVMLCCLACASSPPLLH